MAERMRPRPRKRRLAVGRLILACLLLLVLLGGIVAGILLLTKKGTPEAALTQLPFSGEVQHTFTGAGFLYRTGEGLSYYDLKDEKKNYSAAVTAEAITLAGSGNVHVIYNDTALKILGAEFANEFPGRLLSVACGSAHIAALRQDPAGTEALQVFDLTGTQRDQLIFDGQFIVDFGFYTAKSEYLWVQTLDVQSGSPVTTVHIYNMTLGSVSGLLQLQNQLVERVCFTQSSIYVIGTNQIIRYALENNREAYREMVYGWKVIDADAAPVFLLSPRSEGDTLGTLKVLACTEEELSGATETILQAPAGALRMFLMGEKIVAITPDTIWYYSRSGEKLAEYRLPERVDRVEKLNATTLLLYQGNGLYLYQV